jgi:ribosomal protein L34
MSSMVGGSGEKGRRQLGPNGVRKAKNQGFQCRKVAVQGQAVLGAFLGVELRGKNIIARNGGGKAPP